ncbi:MAG: hypothetical protein RIB86_24960, partial [Imperialibacter sp.]
FQLEEQKHFFANAYDYLKDLPKNLKIMVGKAKKAKKKIQKHEVKSARDYPDIPMRTGLEMKAMGQLRKRIKLEGDKSNLATLANKMQDPQVAAAMTRVVREKLVTSVTKYKTEKMVEELRFLKERKSEVEKLYMSAQMELARYQDSNQGRVTQSVRAHEQYLESKFRLYFGLFNTLSQQVEQAEIQLKKDTPLFSEFEPVTIPLSPDEPKASKIVPVYSLVGIALGLLAIFVGIIITYFLEGRKARMKETISDVV